ncbi:MAG: glycerol-3-phosphate dehydrogenase/oxidase [Candidatus Thermoplasmatota archaeon]
MANEPLDLLVIGGGINGAAIARDAALRGLSVCLVEAGDWGGGTSSRSSKLAHGGLRYLEQFELGLVFEALRDRERFLRHAPHQVRPLQFLYPIYPEVAARRTVRVGLWLYDALSLGKSLPTRKFLKPTAARTLVSGLAETGLTGAATFWDAQIQHVERLVAEMVWDARRNGAAVHNHTRVERILLESGRVAGAVVRDASGESRTIRASAVVNATGCWVDETLGPLAAGKPAKVRKTKGIHVAVPRVSDTAVMVKARDGRSFFVLPWGNHSLIGTTDSDYRGDVRAVRAEPEEVSYLLDEASRYLPGHPLEPILYTYAGVRALVNEEGVTESNVTRRHILHDHGKRDGAAGLWSLQGGKITTARTLAEDCVDRVARFLGRPALARVHPTRKTPYPGGEGVESWSRWLGTAAGLARAAGVPEDVAAAFVARWGALWPRVLACDGRPEARQLLGATGLLGCEVSFAVREQQAIHLDDVVLRRTDLVWRGGDPDGAVANWMMALLDWDGPRLGTEQARLAQEMLHFAVPEAHIEPLA